MELAVVVGIILGLIVFDLPARRFGVDSRELSVDNRESIVMAW